MADHGIDLSKLADILLGDLNKALDGAKGKGETLGEALGEGIVKGVSSAKADIVDAMIDEKAIKQRIKDLQKSSANAARQMKRTMEKGMNPDYGANIARYDGTIKRNARDIEALTNQLREQGIVVKNNTKAYKELQAALEDIGYVEKKQKSSAPRKNAASEVKKQTDAEKEHIKTVEETADAAADQAKAAQKTKKTHDDAAAAAKERAKAEQEISDVSKTQAKILDNVTVKTQKQTDAIKKQEKATRDLAKAQQTVNVKKQSTKTMADFQKLWSKASKNYSAEDFGKRYGHLMESISGDNPTMTIDAAYKELQKKDREYRKQLAAENAKSQVKAVELQAFNAAMSPLMAQINASEKLTQQYAKALEGITAGSLTAAAATERLQEALRGVQLDTSNANKQSQRAEELKKLVANQEEWLRYLNVALDADRFQTSGKKEATSKLREATAILLDRRRNKYKYSAGEYAKEMTEVQWARAYQEAERQGVANSTLGRYHTDANFNYKENLKTLQEVYDFRQGLLTKYQDELDQINQVIGGVRAETAAIEHQTKVVEKNVKVQQQRLKLTKTEGGYTAIDGQYKITKGAKDDVYKWYVTQRDASGRYSAWDGFDSLDEIRNDEFLIAQQEVVSQLKAFNLFETPSGQVAMFDGMTESAEKATLAVKELNDVAQEVVNIPGQISLKQLEKKFDIATDLIQAQRQKHGDAFDGMYKDMFDSLGELNYSNAEAIIDEMTSRIAQRLRDQRQAQKAETKVVEENTQALTKNAQARADISNVGYHAGDLGKAESESAKSAQDAAKAKLTTIQRQAYNYRRATGNSAALTEREGTLSGQLNEIESIRNEFPALEKACASAAKAVTKTLDSIRAKMQSLADEAHAGYASTQQVATLQAENSILEEKISNLKTINTLIAQEELDDEEIVALVNAYRSLSEIKPDSAAYQEASVMMDQIAQKFAEASDVQKSASHELLRDVSLPVEKTLEYFEKLYDGMSLDEIKKLEASASGTGDSYDDATSSAAGLTSELSNARQEAEKLVKISGAIGFHGTPTGGYKEVDMARAKNSAAYWLTDDLDLATKYANGTRRDVDLDSDEQKQKGIYTYKVNGENVWVVDAKGNGSGALIGIKADGSDTATINGKQAVPGDSELAYKFATKMWYEFKQQADGQYVRTDPNKKLVYGDPDFPGVVLNIDGQKITAYGTAEQVIEQLLQKGVEETVVNTLMYLSKTGSTQGSLPFNKKFNTLAQTNNNAIAMQAFANGADTVQFDNISNEGVASTMWAVKDPSQQLEFIPKYIAGLQESGAATELAIADQKKLVQSTEEVAAAAEKATQQVEEQTASLREQNAVQPQVTTKLTASEYQAAFGGGVLDQFLGGFNITGRAASGIADIAADAMRGQKMMIEGSKSDDMELLNAGAQLFSESVRKASSEIMNLGSTVDGTDDALKDFYAYMSGKRMRYDDSYKSEFGGKKEWNATRARFHNVLTQDASGIPVDTLYQEILELFPGMFDKDVINEKDQLVRILDMLGKARDAKKNNWQKTLPIHGSLEEVQGEVASVFMNMGSALERANQEQAKLADGQQDIANAAEQTTNELDKQNEKRREAVEAQEIIERTISDAIDQLRTAGDNETTLFSLKGTNTGEDLVDEARSFVNNIAEQSNLKLGKFTVKDDIIQAQLYNDELKVVVDQTYRLQQATEEAGAALELIGQSFSQNVKALNANNFDVDGIRARAAASVEKLKSSLHGLEYDTSGLEDAAKNIASQADFTKFNNQLKAAQDQIQAIKNSTVSKNTMNQLANMQRDMQNANIELDTMKLRLQKLGDVEGAEEATKAIERMTDAVQSYNDAQGAEAQQKAYNEYSTARSEFRARLENLNVKKSVGSSSEKEDGSSSVAQYYEKILGTLKEINKLDTDIASLQLKDGGTGIFSGLIKQLEQQRSVLMSSVESIAGDISSTFADGFVFGETQINRPDLSVFDDFANVNVPQTIFDFFNDVNVQATIGAEKVAQFLSVLNSSAKIKLDFKSKILPQFQELTQMVKLLDQLFQESAIGGSNQTYADITQRTAALAAVIQQQKNVYGDDYSQWDKDTLGYIQAETKALLERGDALAKVAKAEQKYFSGMKKATAGETYDTTAPSGAELSVDVKGGDTVKTQKQQLEEWINTFGKGKAVITDFTKTADGINKINFTIFDEATHSFHTFTAAMGSASDNIHYTETSMKNMTAGTAAANKVLQSLQETMGRLGALKSAGFNVDGYIDQLTAKAVELRNKMQSVGSSTDVGEQTGLKNKAAEIQKILRDLAKLEEQWRKTQQAIDEDPDRSLGTIDKTGDKYAQMYAKIRAAAGDATISNQKFDDATNTLTYTLTDADGKVVQMAAHMDALTGTVTTQQGKVGQLRTAWQDVSAGLGGLGKEALRYAANLFQVMDIVRYMRTGFNEVLAIDTSLTELRKVTDETSATYSNFLQTMSKTGSVVGSTVKDLVTSSADWARLNI